LNLGEPRRRITAGGGSFLLSVAKAGYQGGEDPYKKLLEHIHAPIELGCLPADRFDCKL